MHIKGNADTTERAFQLLIDGRGLLGGNIDGVWIKLAKYLGNGTLNQFAHVDRIDILLVDNVEDRVDLVATDVGVAPVFPDLYEMVTDEDAQGDTCGYDDRQPDGQTFILVHK